MEHKRPKILIDAGYEIYCNTVKLWELDVPIVDFEISKLLWNFDLPFWEKDGTDDWNLTPWDVINKVDGSAGHQKRVKEVDLTFPILVTRKKKKWLVIDGVHRLVKAFQLKNRTIKVKIIPTRTLMGNNVKTYRGIIIEESLTDISALESLTTLSVRADVDQDNPDDVWHLHTVEVSEEDIQKLQSYLKREGGWYMHFWNDDDMIIVFRDKLFHINYRDKTTWKDAVAYGISVGVPEEQLSFSPE